MIGGSLASEFERNSTGNFPHPKPITPVNCYGLKPNWAAKIAKNDKHASSLMQRILLVESSMGDSRLPCSSLTESASAAILEHSNVQQGNLAHTFSCLNFIPPPPDSEEEPDSLQIKQEPDLIEWLKEKEHFSLAEKFESHAGYPWDEFEKIRNPILLEQLVDIYLICKQKEASNEDTDQLIKFALRLASLATAPNLKEQCAHSHDIVNDAKQVLGQFIYLINQDPHQTAKAIATPHYQAALENIKIAFSNKIHEICERLQKDYLAHKTTQLQDPEIALHTKIPLEIARAILTDIGTINIGIIDTLSDIFLSHENRYINHETNLSHALKLLQRSPKLRAEFEKIHAPNSSNVPSNHVIQATLGLPPEHEITQSDTRLTVLTAMLSHLRQGEDGSCFATSIAIEIQSAHLGFCLKDLRQLMEDGKLTRRIKGVQKDIPFVQKINDEDLRKKLTFNAKGELIVKNQTCAHLWEAPGLIAACQSIGITNPQKAIMGVVAQLPPIGKDDTHQVEVRVILRKICEQVATKHESNAAALDHFYRQACFAFSSQTAQPLLKVWGNAIANMSEAEEGSMIKTAILQSTLDAFQFKLGESAIRPTPFLQRFFIDTQKLLYEKMRLQYDPTMGNASEGGKTEGGFVLHNQMQEIHDEDDFRCFLAGTLKDVQRKLQNEAISPSETKQLNQVIALLTHYLKTKECMGYLLARYHPTNKTVVRELAYGHSIDYTRLKFTPWLTQTGNDSKALLKVFLESEKPIQTRRLTITNAEDALANIIEMCKHMSEDEKRLHLQNPNKLKPLCILGKHRLPFMAGNPSLVKAWQDDCSTKDWIDRFVNHPGQAIAETVIDKTVQQTLVQRIEEEILPKHMSENDTLIASERIKEIQEGMTIKQYRNAVIKICQEVHPISKPLAKKLARQVDTVLCDSLDLKLKRALEDSAVHFADTNWCSGSQDLHFCFAINPGTGQLELWEVHANGSHLMALDQNYWLFNQKWEFLTIPDDLVPDDSLYVSHS